MTNQPGLNLADLAPMHQDVPVGDSFLRVHGIPVKLALEIFRRFPKIAGMVSGEQFNISAFLSTAPDAVAAIIAASVGQLGNEKAETAAAAIPLETQFDILEAIGGMTFTKGFAPFVQRVMALANVASSASFTKVPDMKSPPASKPASQPDTPPM